MNTEFLHYIRPYLIATQCIASGRKADVDEIIAYCHNPSDVEPSGRKNLYKIYSDMFNLYKVDAPANLYAVTPATLNNYARVYAKYVLKTELPEFDALLDWQNAIQDMYDLQRGNAYQLLLPMLQLNVFGKYTVEISVFICNMLALALNSQVLLLTPTVYKALLAYYADEQWQAIDELTMFYGRYREFLNREYAFAYYVYLSTVQFGYADPIAPDGSITYVYDLEGYKLKAKFNSGTNDWLLTVYGMSKTPIGSVSYTHVTTRCRATGSVTSDILAKLWYRWPNHLTRSCKFDVSVFSHVFKHVNNAGKRMPLIVQHLRDNYVTVCGDLTLVTYKTSWSSIIHVRRGQTLIGTVEYGNGSCFANNAELETVLKGLSLTGETHTDTLVQSLDAHIKAKFNEPVSAHTVVTEIVDLLHQYDIRGLDILEQGITSSKM